MAVDFTVATLERTLQQFYHDFNARSEANQYLTVAQLSPEAWNFSWELLKPTKPQEVQFFGASTLQVKISKFWHELPSDQYDSLRNKLLEAIIAYSGGPKIVLTRLCVALSSYIIHTLPEHWPSAIIDVIAALQPENIPTENAHQVVHVLLRLLTILPEELQSSHMKSSQRGVIRNSLESSLQQVLNLVQDCLSQPDSTSSQSVHQMALKCYSSWAQLSPSILEYEPLLVCTLNAVYNENLYQSALEVLTNVSTHPDSYKYPNSLLKLIEQLVKLDDLLSRAIQEKDMDVCCSIYNLFITIAEAHCRLLLNMIVEKPSYKDIIIKLMGLILQCSATPGQYPIEEICSELAFGFWYTLQDDISSSDSTKFETFLVMFHPLFHSLVDTYLTKVKYPDDDIYKQWSTTEKESFRCYRQDIGDSFMYCYNILREAMLANLIAHLNIAIANAVKDSTQWQYLEACLYAFQSVAESVDFEEQNYILQFMTIIPAIPLQHFRVVSTAMDAVGAYAEWINNHPNSLECVIPLLMMGLQNSEVATSATMALKDITRDCQECLIPFAEEILSTSKGILEGTTIKSRERIRLMATVGKVLSLMNMDFIMSFLNSLLAPMIQQLQQIVSEQPSVTRKSAVILHLNMLSMLFATLDIRLKDSEKELDQKEAASKEQMPSEKSAIEPLQPVFLVLQQVLPVLLTVGTNWSFDEQVIEALCEVLRRAISTLLDDCSPLVPDIVQLVLYLYKHSSQTSVLDIVKQLLLLFGNDTSHKENLLNFFSEVCNHTLSLCQTDLREHTSLADIFFQTLAQLIRKVPSFFECKSVNLEALFQCSILALSLPEKSTVKSSSSFISEFITRSREITAMLDVVNNHGEALIGQVLRVIGGESPRAAVEHMSDILLALNKKYFDNLCRWMSTYLQQQGFPSPRVTHEQKEHFTRLVLKERSNKRKLKESVTEFSLICRGLIGTEYAAQIEVSCW